MTAPSPTWAQIVAAPDGPYGLYSDYERVILIQAKNPENARGSLQLASEVIATKALLRDTAAARAFIGAIAPVFKAEGELLEVVPDLEPPMWAVQLAVIEIASDTVGAPLRLPTETQLPQRLSEALKDEPKDEDQLTVGLLSVLRQEFDRIDAYQFSSEWMRSLVVAFRRASQFPAEKPRALDAFEGYLRDFPVLLLKQSTSWHHLLLAAVLALGELAGAPRSDVAETLRKKIAKLGG